MDNPFKIGETVFYEGDSFKVAQVGSWDVFIERDLGNGFTQRVRVNWQDLYEPELEDVKPYKQQAADQQAVIQALETERNAYRAALVAIMHRTLPFEPVLQPGQVRLYIEQYIGWKFGQIARQALAAYPKAKTEAGG